eukprot:1446566-Amphidinium_carterae.1
MFALLRFLGYFRLWDSSHACAPQTAGTAGGSQCCLDPKPADAAQGSRAHSIAAVFVTATPVPPLSAYQIGAPQVLPFVGRGPLANPRCSFDHTILRSKPKETKCFPTKVAAKGLVS